MASGYTRQAAGEITTGSVIQASSFNNEYNALQTAFDATGGHTHDGTTGGGAKIPPAGLTNLTSTSSGIICADGANSINARTLTGTAAEITVTNGTGASGNPTLSLPSALTFTGKTVTGGTFNTPTINVNANVLSIRDNTDTTKVAQFVCSTIATGTTRSYTLPNANGTMALTSDISALSSVYQPLDGTLTSLAAYNTNGILTQTAADTFTGRTITGTTNRLSVTNGNGVSGNPTLDIDANYVGQATITTLGTVATGTWNATTIGTTKGGTGLTSYTTGDLIQATASNTLSALASVATGNVLLSGGVATASSWGKVGLTTHVSGILPVANGGTNNAFFTISGPATSAKTYTVPNASCNLLTDNALVTVAQGGTGLGTLTANNVILGNGTSTPTFVAPGTSGNVLTSNGTTWQSTAPATGAMVLLSTQTASSSSSIDFTAALSSTYSKYVVEIFDLVPASAAQILCRVNTGGGYISTGTYDQGVDGRDSEGNPMGGELENTTSLSLSANENVATSSNLNNFTVNIYNPSHASKRTAIMWNGLWITDGTTRHRPGYGGGSNQTTSAVTGIQFLMSSGNITSGTFKLYGIT